MEFNLDKKWPVALLVLLLAGAGGFWLGPSKVAFRATPDRSLRPNSAYPSFKGGVLTIQAEGKEHKITLAENTETLYKGLPKSLIGSSVTASLESPYWKLKTGSVTLEKNTSVDLVPDGSLAVLYGNVTDQNGSPVSNAAIRIGNDTVLYTNDQGVFKAELSYSLQKENQVLTISKNGYVAQELNHHPGSNLVVRMSRAASGGKTTVIEKEKGDSFGTFVAKEAVKAGFRKHF